MKRFTDLGAPFPLFEAPVSEATSFVGRAECSLCGHSSEVCFELGIGCALIVPCPKCSAANGLDASDRDDCQCRQCSASIDFPEIADPVVVCYDCLRAGKAAMTQDTELGMISWEQAFEGLTHGVPGLAHPDFELVKTKSDWVRARLPAEVLFEFLRTPTYSTIQGERWQFCCRTPMIYAGRWTREDFTRHAPAGDGHAYFSQIVEKPVPGLWEDKLHDVTGIYVFRCRICGERHAHWDIA